MSAAYEQLRAKTAMLRFGPIRSISTSASPAADD
jgi:hypothetical protein